MGINHSLDPDWMEQILSTLREGVLVVDNELRLVYMNKAAAFLGFDLANASGKTIFEIFPGLQPETSSFAQVLLTEVPIHNKIQTFITFRNERRVTLTSTFPLYRDGALSGAFEVFEDVSAITSLSEQVISLQEKIRPQVQNRIKNQNLTIEPIIGESPELKLLRKMIPTVANSVSPILIYGETGTGKELVVKAIHGTSPRSNGPLVAQNCAAIPDTLLEGILFGTTKGAFTGAEDKPGLFELADGGTLFLDEINSMSVHLQAKLLRVIQDGLVRRVGGRSETPVHVRLIAATNVHPSSLISSGELRADLFYRLNVLNLDIAPLRNRKEDITLLVDHFITQYNVSFSKQVRGVDRETLDYFMEYDWPGNVRELKNLIERAMNVVEGETIQLQHLNLSNTYIASSGPTQTGVPGPLADVLSVTEKELIKRAIAYTEGNISKAARCLDIPQQTMDNKIKKYDLRSYVYWIKSLPKNK